MLTGCATTPRHFQEVGRSGGIQTRVSGLKARNPGSLDDASLEQWVQWDELEWAAGLEPAASTVA